MSEEGKCSKCGSPLLKGNRAVRWILVNGFLNKVDAYECGTIPKGIINDVYPDGNNPQTPTCKDRQISQQTQEIADKDKRLEIWRKYPSAVKNGGMEYAEVVMELKDLGEI